MKVLVKRAKEATKAAHQAGKLPKKHHVALGTVAAVALSVAALLVPGKSKKALAERTVAMEIMAPADDLTVEAVASTPSEMPMVAGLAMSGAAMLPAADIYVRPLVTLTNRDGIPLEGSLKSETGIAAGLFKRGNVLMTKDLAVFAKGLSQYFAAKDMAALVTSGVRTSVGQLDIIKQRISEHGMMNAFPGLKRATIADTSAWIEAWEWLKSRRVPVNPPADYVNDDGAKVGGSLHLKGLAMDLVSDDLDALRDELAAYAKTQPRTRKSLKITGLVREADCVHVSLGY